MRVGDTVAVLSPQLSQSSVVGSLTCEAMASSEWAGARTAPRRSMHSDEQEAQQSQQTLASPMLTSASPKPEARFGDTLAAADRARRGDRRRGARLPPELDPGHQPARPLQAHPRLPPLRARFTPALTMAICKQRYGYVPRKYGTTQREGS